MKKSHPDESKIPTLRDLVFPGKQELRRMQSRERDRIEPQLASSSEWDAEDAFSPTLDDSRAADAFILLPEEHERSWESAQTSEQIDGQREESASAAGIPAPDADDFEAYDITQVGDDEQQGLTDEATAPAPLDGNAVDPEAPHPPADQQVEDDVSIEDLMTYFHHLRPSSNAISEPFQASPPPAVSTDLPPAAEPTAVAAMRTPAEDDIRAAVRSTLEQELDRLTDIVTDAVIARLRE